MNQLAAYRDDGPLARAIARSARRRGVLPPAVWQLLGAVPLVILIAVKGGDVSNSGIAGAIGIFIGLAGHASGEPHTDRLRWAAPPILRAVEYTTILWIGAAAGASSQPAAFALICALAFRHYDLVYRFRHQGLSPPAWIALFGLGWDGRLILGWVLLALGALPAGFYVLAILFGVVFAGESVASWLRFVGARRPALYDDEEDIAE